MFSKSHLIQRCRLLLAVLLSSCVAVPVVARGSRGSGSGGYLGGDVSVRGYYRSNGTYVQPYYRSAPDGNFWNNWSTKGNINPYTGKEGTRLTPPLGYGGYGLQGGATGSPERVDGAGYGTSSSGRYSEAVPTSDLPREVAVEQALRRARATQLEAYGVRIDYSLYSSEELLDMLHECERGSAADVRHRIGTPGAPPRPVLQTAPASWFEEYLLDPDRAKVKATVSRWEMFGKDETWVANYEVMNESEFMLTEIGFRMEFYRDGERVSSRMTLGAPCEAPALNGLAISPGFSKAVRISERNVPKANDVKVFVEWVRGKRVKK